jgi:hypothetical protein
VKVSQRPHESSPSPCASTSSSRSAGLPEELPADERCSGRAARTGARWRRAAFHLRKLAVYFALMLALRGSVVLADGGSALDAIRAVATLAGRWHCWARPGG